MRCKRVITVDETCTLPDHRDTYAVDFSGENDALTPKCCLFGRTILKYLTHSVVRPVCRRGSALTAGALVGQCMPPRQARGQPLHPIYAPLLLTREVAANVRCGIGSSAVPGTAVSESGRLRQGPTAIREATAAAAC